ncbi:hypothetical protein TNIN_205091 [Trichonephila inaurata madagascariensis]|uniref:Uncharacterized protein n=1 Tax=Trichonephila inaurata madagascariensis TaxID=2747483 RepID=A0A8X6WXA2_9ARAC|nr:hypothetical protein TNIN_205091 [Trichonephila inaurata madagascariensis]
MFALLTRRLTHNVCGIQRFLPHVFSEVPSFFYSFAPHPPQKGNKNPKIFFLSRGTRESDPRRVIPEFIFGTPFLGKAVEGYSVTVLALALSNTFAPKRPITFLALDRFSLKTA